MPVPATGRYGFDRAVLLWRGSDEVCGNGRIISPGPDGTSFGRPENPPLILARRTLLNASGNLFWLLVTFGRANRSSCT
ncbi:hypothetical protein KCP71_24005 [Salmonella enterica subsp. enterica]|nr:hypothetical protein KCP71_24005 [Salmonella enterica subsp. enterica]